MATPLLPAPTPSLPLQQPFPPVRRHPMGRSRDLLLRAIRSNSLVPTALAKFSSTLIPHPSRREISPQPAAPSSKSPTSRRQTVSPLRVLAVSVVPFLALRQRHPPLLRSRRWFSPQCRRSPPRKCERHSQAPPLTLWPQDSTAILAMASSWPCRRSPPSASPVLPILR